MGIRKLVALLGSATLGLGLAVSSAPPAQAAVFNLSNASPIVFVNDGPINATTYPSPITEFGMSTTITDVNVTLSSITHSFTGDLDVMLISPQGTSIVLTSDNCDFMDATSRTYTFDDSAVAPLANAVSVCASGSYKPSNGTQLGGDEVFPDASPDITTLAGFNGQNPNGSWGLYVRDDNVGDTGQITSWSLQITTASQAPITVPAVGSGGGGQAAPYPVPIAVTGQSGLITDVNVTLPGLSHTHFDDLDFLLVAPNGTNVELMSDACGSDDTIGVNLTFDDQAAASPHDTLACTTGSFKPINYVAGDVWPAPAPAGAHGTTMSVFNGAGANGTWSLYINDDAGNDGGWMSQPTLAITTTDVIPPDTQLKGKKPENTTKTKAKIKFEANEAGVTFRCKVDSKKYKSCTSPLRLKNLKVGKHKVLIVATDAAGNVESKALKIKWKIFPKN